LIIDIDHIGERSMTRFATAQTISIALSATYVLITWLTTLGLPVGA
jgi:hypothetical protein